MDPSESLNTIDFGMKGVMLPSASTASETAGSIIVLGASRGIGLPDHRKLQTGVEPLPRRAIAIGGRKKISRSVST